MHGLWLAAGPTRWRISQTAPVLLLPAQLPLERRQLDVPRPPLRGAGLLGAGAGLPRLRPGDAATPSRRWRGGRPCRLEFGWPGIPGRPRFTSSATRWVAHRDRPGSQVADEAGTIVEGTFVHPGRGRRDKNGAGCRWAADHATLRGPCARWHKVGSPLLVVHGANDQLIGPELGRRLYGLRQTEVLRAGGGSPQHAGDRPGAVPPTTRWPRAVRCCRCADPAPCSTGGPWCAICYAPGCVFVAAPLPPPFPPHPLAPGLAVLIPVGAAGHATDHDRPVPAGAAAPGTGFRAPMSQAQRR